MVHLAAVCSAGGDHGYGFMSPNEARDSTPAALHALIGGLSVPKRHERMKQQGQGARGVLAWLGISEDDLKSKKEISFG